MQEHAKGGGLHPTCFSRHPLKKCTMFLLNPDCYVFPPCRLSVLWVVQTQGSSTLLGRWLCPWTTRCTGGIISTPPASPSTSTGSIQATSGTSTIRRIMIRTTPHPRLCRDISSTSSTRICWIRRRRRRTSKFGNGLRAWTRVGVPGTIDKRPGGVERGPQEVLFVVISGFQDLIAAAPLFHPSFSKPGRSKRNNEGRHGHWVMPLYLCIYNVSTLSSFGEMMPSD